MKLKKILTMVDLVKFCEDQSIGNFSSKESGYQLSVQIPTTFELEEHNNADGLMRLKFKLMHTGLNRNGSYFSKESVDAAIPSFQNRPILAYIHQREDGVWDFWSHNYVIEDDGTVNYIEQQVGSLTSEAPFYEYDEKLKKEYICAYGVIPEEYTKAAEILKRKAGTKNSVEVSINSFNYNAKERRLEITDWYLSGTTLLGSDDNGNEIGEGMIGSRADLTDFSTENNSVLPKANTFSEEKIVELMGKIDDLLSSLNKNNSKEGGIKSVSKFEELLEKYGKNASDIDFDYTTLSDEELEQKFSEMFDGDGDTGENDSSEPETEPETSPENTSNENSDGDENSDGPEEEDPVTDGQTEAEENDEAEKNYSIKKTVEFDGITKEFTLSLNQIQEALSRLVNETYGDSDDTWYSVIVYEDGVLVMADVWNNRFYRQAYTRSEDTFSLSGERVSVHPAYITDDEQKVLDDMKSNYPVVTAELKEYKFNELLGKDEYASIKDNEDVKVLKDNLNNYSLDELTTKLDEALLAYVKSGNSTFASNGSSKIPCVNLGVQKPKDKKPNRYGDIFKTNN